MAILVTKRGKGPEAADIEGKKTNGDGKGWAKSGTGR